MCSNEKRLESLHVWALLQFASRVAGFCYKLMGHQYEQGNFPALMTSQYGHCVWDYYFLQFFSKEWILKFKLYIDVICAYVYCKLAKPKQDNNKENDQEIYYCGTKNKEAEKN